MSKALLRGEVALPWRRAAFGLSILAGCIAFVLAIVIFYSLSQHQRQAYRWVDHTLEVIVAADGVGVSLQTASADARGYLLDHRPESRLRFEAARSQTGMAVSRLRMLTGDNPRQQAAIVQLEQVVASRFAASTEAFARLEHNEPEALQALLRSGRGQSFMDAAMSSLSAIVATERSLLAERTAKAGWLARLLLIAGITCGAVVAASLVLIAAQFKMIQQRRRLIAELQSEVQSRTAALSESEARFRTYFAMSPDGLIVLRKDDNGEYIYKRVNPAALEILGMTEESLIGRKHRDVWPPEIGQETLSRFAEAERAQRPIVYTSTRMLRGEPRVLEIELAALPGRAGYPACILASTRDATARHALERRVLEQAELRAQAAELAQAVFQNSSDMLFVVRVQEGSDAAEPRFICEAFSPATERLIGRKLTDLVERSPRDCLQPGMARAFCSDLQSCFERGEAIASVAVYALPSGARRFETALTPVRNPATGQIVRIVGAARDVTERTDFEERLQQAQKIEMIGHLASGVAHDFNNVLHSITGSLELIQDQLQLGPNERGLVRAALGSAQRGASLTHHLLAYVRKQTLLPRVTDIGALLEDMQEMLSRTVGPHITVTRHVSAGIARVNVDPEQLQTAIFNLAINAAHAMPQGGLLLIEATEQQAPFPAGPIDQVVVAVTDTGAGIDDATLAQVFEPFFTTKASQGTGLGLSMVQAFAQRSGGDIRISSTVGTGTRVEIWLPPATGPEPVSPSADADGRGGMVQAEGSGRVLLVDDMADALATSGAFLEAAGLQVMRCGRAHQALAAMSGGERFDAIVTDYAMPEINGVQLIRSCRDIQPDLPALLVTGLALGEELDDLPAGTLVLRKPFQRAKLLSALSIVMEQSDMRQPDPVAAG